MREKDERAGVVGREDGEERPGCDGLDGGGSLLGGRAGARRDAWDGRSVQEVNGCRERRPGAAEMRNESEREREREREREEVESRRAGRREGGRCDRPTAARGDPRREAEPPRAAGPFTWTPGRTRLSQTLISIDSRLQQPSCQRRARPSGRRGRPPRTPPGRCRARRGPPRASPQLLQRKARDWRRRVTADWRGSLCGAHWLPRRPRADAGTARGNGARVSPGSACCRKRLRDKRLRGRPSRGCPRSRVPSRRGLGHRS